MTDRELLEKAAKAAGIDCDAQVDNGTVVTAGEAPSFWNPLTDDGDALRLAVKLGLNVSYETWTNNESVVVVEDRVEYVDENPYSATRRAIVQAAAEIGKTMKD